MDSTSSPPLGSLVVIGPRYVMADRPPYGGHGRYESDEWTGRTMRVVGYDKTGGVKLAPPELVGADDSDEEVTAPARRLTLVP